MRRLAVNIQRIVAMAAVVIVGISGAVYAADQDDATLARERTLDTGQRGQPETPLSDDVTEAKRRPAALSSLYVSLGAIQAWDVYSTSAALKAGAREANPSVAPFAGSAGALLGLKLATSASTIFFAERMAKKNRVAAIVTMVAVNGATAAIAMHNMQNAKRATGR